MATITRGKRGGKSGKAVRKTSRKSHYEWYTKANIREVNKCRGLMAYLKRALRLGWLKEGESSDIYIKRSTRNNYGYDKTRGKVIYIGMRGIGR